MFCGIWHWDRPVSSIHDQSIILMIAFRRGPNAERVSLRRCRNFRRLCWLLKIELKYGRKSSVSVPAGRCRFARKEHHSPLKETCGLADTVTQGGRGAQERSRCGRFSGLLRNPPVEPECG